MDKKQNPVILPIGIPLPPGFSTGSGNSRFPEPRITPIRRTKEFY